MTNERFEALQREIARLKEIDKQTTDKVRATYSLSDWADDKKMLDELEEYSNTEQKVHHSQIHIPCSKELDMEWANESENIQ